MATSTDDDAAAQGYDHGSRLKDASMLAVRVAATLIAGLLVLSSCSSGSDIELGDTGATTEPSTAELDTNSDDADQTTADDAEPVDVDDIVTGSYDTTYGPMTLELDGTQVRGSYPNGATDGDIAADLGGDGVVTGTWMQETSSQRCDEERNGTFFWGRIEFTFSSDGFVGVWSNCDDALDGKWDGSRVGDGDAVTPARVTPENRREADPLLVVVASRGDLEEVERLLAEGADPDVARASDAWTPLVFAAQEGHTEVIGALIDAGADVDLGTEDGWTALMIASQNGHLDTVTLLVDRGADPTVGRSSNWTALHSATLQGRTEVVPVLLDAGASVRASEDGFTPLTIAAQEGETDIARLLLDAGSSTFGNAAGPSPLYMAAQNGHREVLGVLLDAGADPDNGGSEDAPIIVAAGKGVADAIEILVEGGADVDIVSTGRSGYTALHWAANNDDPDVARVLLDLGADSSIEDADGNTPLDLAIRLDHDDVAAVLRG